MISWIIGIFISAIMAAILIDLIRLDYGFYKLSKKLDFANDHNKGAGK